MLNQSQSISLCDACHTTLFPTLVLQLEIDTARLHVVSSILIDNLYDDGRVPKP
jgi:hypothetical protein